MKNTLSKNDVRVRIANSKNGQAIFKMIIAHPMETGYRRSRKTGKKIPADYIDQLTVSIDGAPVFEIKLGINISKNPFLGFNLTQPVYNGQNLTVSWTDNQHKQVTHEQQVDLDNNGTFNMHGHYTATAP